jgi:hypothetical protein
LSLQNDRSEPNVAKHSTFRMVEASNESLFRDPRA